MFILSSLLTYIVPTEHNIFSVKKITIYYHILCGKLVPAMVLPRQILEEEINCFTKLFVTLVTPDT